MDLIDELQAAARRIPTMGGRANPEPAASAAEVAEFERRVGRPLPAVWQRVYTEIGDGGFGPGYGFLSLVTGAARTDEGNSAAGFVELLREGEDPDDPDFKWPDGLVPICHWGCAIYSCLDLRSAEVPIVRFDPNGHGPDDGWDGAWWQEAASSEAWLRAWAEGRLRFESPAA